MTCQRRRWFPGNDASAGSAGGTQATAKCYRLGAVAAFLAESPKKWQLPTNQLLTVDPANVELIRALEASANWL